MATKYILAALSAAFLIAAALRVSRDAGKLLPQSRTWLLVGVVFAVVSTWLFARG